MQHKYIHWNLGGHYFAELSYCRAKIQTLGVCRRCTSKARVHWKSGTTLTHKFTPTSPTPPHPPHPHTIYTCTLPRPLTHRLGALRPKVVTLPNTFTTPQTEQLGSRMSSCATPTCIRTHIRTHSTIHSNRSFVTM